MLAVGDARAPSDVRDVFDALADTEIPMTADEVVAKVQSYRYRLALPAGARFYRLEQLRPRIGWIAVKTINCRVAQAAIRRLTCAPGADITIWRASVV